MNFIAQFELLTKNDIFCLTRTISGETFHDAIEKAKDIAFSEFNDNIISLKIFNDKYMTHINF